MLRSNAPEQDGVDSHSESPERGRRGYRPSSSSEDKHANILNLPKNRSTGNLLQHAGRSIEKDKARIRFSFDAGERDTMSRAALMTDHDHGMGLSGLRRIRQQPPARINTMGSASSSRAPSVGPRSASLSTAVPPQSRKSSHGGMSTVPSSPTNYTEDLSRFPSESLHSFSFAHQSAEEFVLNRQNVLKRSIEFMSKSNNRLGSNLAALTSAQARVTGDQETQNMIDLLRRASLVSAEGAGELNGLGFSTGPLTSPPQFDRENIFDKKFGERSESPDDMMSQLSPTQTKLSASNQLEEPASQLTSPRSNAEQDLKNLATSEPTSEVLSRTTTGESETLSMRPNLGRTYTDTGPLKLQNTLIDAMVQPYPANEKYPNGKMLSPPMPPAAFSSVAQTSHFAHSIDSSMAKTRTQQYGVSGPHPVGPAVHGHSSRWAPAAQAIFTTESKAPYTILAANDLACLVFGVTNAEVRKMGIMEVVREERREWLAEKLAQPGSEAEHQTKMEAQANKQSSPRSTTSFLLGRGGITSSLLSKPNSRQIKENRRTQTDDGAGSSIAERRKAKAGPNHANNKSRGVLLCGDVVPIQKRNGNIGSASLWVKEKKGGLIWVLEEIHEDVVLVSLDSDGKVTNLKGSIAPLWGEHLARPGIDIGTMIPRLPRQGIDPRTGALDYAEVVKRKYFTAKNHNQANVPIAIEQVSKSLDLRVSSFPHIAGIVVLCAETLQVTSANTVFSAALFGQEKPDRLHVNDLIPEFDRILNILIKDDGIDLVDGIVVPEQSFRRARAYAALRDGKSDEAGAYFLRPDGIPAKHRDGSEIKIDVQMRVVKSEQQKPKDEHVILEEEEDDDAAEGKVVYALWITYSRHLHAGPQVASATTPLLDGRETPLHQPSPGQTRAPSPLLTDSSSGTPSEEPSQASKLAAQLKKAAVSTVNAVTGRNSMSGPPAPAAAVEPPAKKTIEDFVILEEMGQGAYGQVKLASYKKTGEKVVLKFVTKKRILVDTWTRDRRLGTVPLEIHVLDYLKRNGLQHSNIVEMNDFFEDDVNYYIEMIPHGLPGMDLFDYIEIKVNMEEAECQGLFLQVAKAVHHLHTKANVVHRDIKDENIILDGETNNIKLIDFGSAAYIKSGPFDVFVGTIDYAAPEVLAGKPYNGKEQDIWALGILLYTIIYKENPFYSIDEIMDRDLRIPFIMSEPSIDLIKKMLDRDVKQRMTIQEVLDHPWLSEDFSE